MSARARHAKLRRRYRRMTVVARWRRFPYARMTLATIRITVATEAFRRATEDAAAALDRFNTAWEETA